MKHMLSDPGAAFYTTGQGLRGTPVMVVDKDDGSVIHATVRSNTSTRIWLDRCLPRQPDRYDLYLLGSIPFAIETGDFVFMDPRTMQGIYYVTFEFEYGNKGHFDVYAAADPGSQTNTAWRFIGSVPMKGRTYYRLPCQDQAAFGRTIRFMMISTVPGQEFRLSSMSLDFEEEGPFGG